MGLGAADVWGGGGAVVDGGTAELVERGVEGGAVDVEEGGFVEWVGDDVAGRYVDTGEDSVAAINGEAAT